MINKFNHRKAWIPDIHPFNIFIQEKSVYFGCHYDFTFLLDYKNENLS